jgi:hypothetical protein
VAKSCTLPFFFLFLRLSIRPVYFNAVCDFCDWILVIGWSFLGCRRFRYNQAIPLLSFEGSGELGYSTAAVFVTSAEAAYFASKPEHLPDKAMELISKLGLNFDVAGGVHAYGEVMGPRSFEFSLGAYEEGFALAHEKLYGLVGGSGIGLFDKILALYPVHNILAVELVSGVNGYGYAVYESGVLLRAMGGFYAEPVSIDIGELLPEELKYFARSKNNVKKLVCSEALGGETEQFDPSYYGEDLVFEVAGRFLGKEVAAKPDDTEGPPMQVFKRTIPPRPRINSTLPGTR